jgi:hypothetical protein
VKDLVEEMKNPSTRLGQLVHKMKVIHRKNQGGEDELAKEFAEFCNTVLRRLVQAAGGQSEQQLSSIFRFSGNHLMKDGFVPHPGSSSAVSDNKLDIIVHGENTEDDEDRQWDHALTFGEVKVEISWDLKDGLLGQMLRCLVSALFWLDTSSKCFLMTATNVLALSLAAKNPAEPSSLWQERLFLAVRLFATHFRNRPGPTQHVAHVQFPQRGRLRKSHLCGRPAVRSTLSRVGTVETVSPRITISTKTRQPMCSISPNGGSKARYLACDLGFENRCLVSLGGAGRQV